MRWANQNTENKILPNALPIQVRIQEETQKADKTKTAKLARNTNGKSQYSSYFSLLVSISIKKCTGFYLIGSLYGASHHLISF